MNHLHVCILAGRDIDCKSKRIHCIVNLDDQRYTTNPSDRAVASWEEETKLVVNDMSKEKVCITVLDTDTKKRIGSIQIPLKIISIGETLEKWFSIVHEETFVGEINLRMELVSSHSMGILEEGTTSNEISSDIEFYIRIVQARDLLNDGTEELSPVCSIRLDAHRFTTKAIQNGGSAPYWNEKTMFSLQSVENKAVMIALLDTNFNSIIGQCTIPLSMGFHGDIVDEWFQVQIGDQCTGELQIRFQLENLPPGIQATICSDKNSIEPPASEPHVLDIKPVNTETPSTIDEEIESNQHVEPQDTIYFQIRVVGCRNLSLNSIDASPACCILLGKETFTTKPDLFGGSSAAWNEKTSFRHVNPQDDEIHVTIVDTLTGMNIGHCKVPVSIALHDHVVDEWFQLVSGAVHVGQVNLRLQFHGLTTDELDSHRKALKKRQELDFSHDSQIKPKEHGNQTADIMELAEVKKMEINKMISEEIKKNEIKKPFLKTLKKKNGEKFQTIENLNIKNNIQIKKKKKENYLNLFGILNESKEIENLFGTLKENFNQLNECDGMGDVVETIGNYIDSDMINEVSNLFG